MFSERMNIYKQKSAKFMVFFVCLILIFFSVLTGDYWFLGSLLILVLLIYLYTTSFDYTIGHTETSLIYGVRKKYEIRLEDIQEVFVDNLDYMGKFGGYGYRKFRKQSAYVFNDSGNFLCVKTVDRDYFFSIDDKPYWSNWLEKRRNLPSDVQSFTKISC